MRYFQQRGWTILARNYRMGRREVDVVLRQGDVVAFVEVKTRAGEGYGSPEEAITRLKRREVEAVAAGFIDRHELQDAFVRFDAYVVVVERGEGGGRVVREEHIPNAWP